MLKNIPLTQATVLDVGCGMGENLIALSRMGAKCFGVDISRYMVEMAEAKQVGLTGENPVMFEIEDMRSLTAFQGVSFDLILSVYALEYLRSAKELRDVIATVVNRLKPGGTFLFCFSHPLQHIRHAHFQNETAPAATSTDSNLIYSIRDVVNCLDDCGVTLDRVLEQETSNPSRILYEKCKKYPYHFHKGKNPCIPDFDEFSNAAPHTIIYKARKPPGSSVYLTQPLHLNHGTVELWDSTWTVSERHSFQSMGRRFEVSALKRLDSRERYLCATVLDFSVAQEDIDSGDSIYVPIGETVAGGQVSVSRRSLLGILLKRLRRRGLHPVFGQQRFALREHPVPIGGIFLRRIDPIYGIIDGAFSRRRFDVLLFVNRCEPGSGKVGLDSFFPSLGDRIYVLYVARDRSIIEEHTQEQLPLPGLW
jgi:SAM-dependent methyltransferase